MIIFFVWAYCGNFSSFCDELGSDSESFFLKNSIEWNSDIFLSEKSVGIGY